MGIRWSRALLLTLVILPASSEADTGLATITGTTPDSTLTGTVRLEDTDEGLHIAAQVSGASPGQHGFHIHAFGSCADGGKAAGGHYNPEEVQHGYLPDDGLDEAHAGDLGNLEVGADGSGSLELTLSDLVLTEDDYAVAGRAFVLHADPDDFGQPTGHAGARIGCGTIVLVAD